MRAWIALVAACGPFATQPAQAPQQPVQGPPGGDQWAGTASAEPAPYAPPQPYTYAPVPDTYAPPPPGPSPYDAPPPAPAPSPRPPPRRPPPPPPPPAIPDEAQAFVDAHNADRAKHCAGALTWSPKLAAVAQQWANSLKDKGCAFGHSGGQYGENLAAGTVGLLDANAVVAMWYDEIKDYSFKSGGFSMQTGHFTQVVWRATTQVGCGHTQCNGNDIYVCEYDPAGNYEGQYRENVLPTTCKR